MRVYPNSIKFDKSVNWFKNIILSILNHFYLLYTWE